MFSRVKVGLLGCGAISPAYLNNLTGKFANLVEVVACADLIREKADSRAQEFKIPRVCGLEELLQDPEIELVVNLSHAAAHFSTSMAILQAGKHLFSEKPLAVDREEGSRLVERAAANGLQIGGASDTFLGTGLQTAIKSLEEGSIGVPLFALAMITLRYTSPRGHSIGVGPMFDMGPYYLTAMVALLGPVRRVIGSAETPFPEKPYPPNSPDAGKMFKVETPTNIAGVLNFVSDQIGFIYTCCDGPAYHPRLEVYGTEGVLTANDPNHYGGPVSIKKGGGVTELPPVAGFAERGRGLGVAEMALALRGHRPPRAGGDLMYHVLDIMQAIHETSRTGKYAMLSSTCKKPSAFDGAVLEGDGQA